MSYQDKEFVIGNPENTYTEVLILREAIHLLAGAILKNGLGHKFMFRPTEQELVDRFISAARAEEKARRDAFKSGDEAAYDRIKERNYPEFDSRVFFLNYFLGWTEEQGKTFIAENPKAAASLSRYEFQNLGGYHANPAWDNLHRESIQEIVDALREDKEKNETSS